VRTLPRTYVPFLQIPLPIESAEVRSASERARALLSGRDAPALSAPGPRPRANSLESSYQQTVIGPPRSSDRKGNRASMEHHILCRACNRVSSLWVRLASSG